MAVEGINSGTPGVIRQNCIVFGFYNDEMWLGKFVMRISSSCARLLTPTGSGCRKASSRSVSAKNRKSSGGGGQEQSFGDESRKWTSGKTHSTAIRRLAAPAQCGWSSWSKEDVF